MSWQNPESSALRKALAVPSTAGFTSESVPQSSDFHVLRMSSSALCPPSMLQQSARSADTLLMPEDNQG
jgi:hypothetical protein